MPSQGPNFPTVAAQGAGTSWANINNIKIDDGSVANVSFGSSSTSTANLIGTGFGFSLPSLAIVNGILFELKRSRSGGNIRDGLISLTKDGTNPVGTDKSSPSIWDTSLTYKSYGSSSDLWGLSWTAVEINSANFGVIVEAFNDSGVDNTASIDAYRITVYYTPLPTSFSGAIVTDS